MATRWETKLIRREIEEPALALATMIRGYAKGHYSRLTPPARSVINQIKTDYLNQLGLARDNAKFDAVIGWIEPDIIGEFFGLEMVGRESDVKSDLEFPWISEAAWRLDGAAMLDFVRRARQNFSKPASVSPHIQRGLGAVLMPVPGIFESFVAGAENRMIKEFEKDTVSLSETIEAALDFLRPSSWKDAASALAFGEFVIFAVEYAEQP